MNIKEWNKLSVAIQEGNKNVKWEDRVPYAYWKGNPMVSLVRRNFMKCNVSDKYDDPMVRLYVQVYINLYTDFEYVFNHNVIFY